MSSNLIKNLKEKLKEVIKEQEEVTLKRQNLDIEQFYKDALKFENVTDGMVILITENSVVKRLSPKGITHQKIVQELLDEIYDKHIDLSKEEFDYGETIPLEYNCIFIRMSSMLNGATIVYYPDICNEYQISELEKFNELTRGKTYFEYRNQTNFPNENLDELLTIIKNNLNNNSMKK